MPALIPTTPRRADHHGLLLSAGLFAATLAAVAIARELSALRKEAVWWRRRPVALPRTGYHPDQREDWARATRAWSAGGDVGEGAIL